MVKIYMDYHHRIGIQGNRSLGVNTTKGIANSVLLAVASCSLADSAMMKWAITQWIGNLILFVHAHIQVNFFLFGLHFVEKQHQKWCACTAWRFKQLDQSARHLHAMDFQWPSTIAVYVNFLMMKGTQFIFFF